MTHEMSLNSNGIGHNRQPRGHVLEDFEAAFAPAPEITGQPTDADVRRGQLRGFRRRRPGTAQDRQMPQLQESIADDLQIQSGHASAQVLQEPANSLQASQRASRSDPNQLHALARANVLRQGIAFGIDTSPNDMDAIGPRPES